MQPLGWLCVAISLPFAFVCLRLLVQLEASLKEQDMDWSYSTDRYLWYILGSFFGESVIRYNRSSVK